MLTRRTVIWAIAETVQGTDPAMTAANALLAWDVEVAPEGEFLDRPILRDTLSKAAHKIGTKEIALAFKTEVKGIGVGSTPELDAVLRGCGFGTAAHAGTADIIYSLKSDEADLSSLSFRVFKDGNVHKLTGSRGTIKFVLEAGQYGVAEFEFGGKYNPVVASTVPDISGLSNLLPPVICGAGFQIGGFTPVAKIVELDLSNNVVRRDDLNEANCVNSFRLSGRDPKMNFTVDAVVESSNPFWGDWEGEVVDTFGILAGTTLGNIVNFTGFYQYDSVNYTDDDGVQTYEAVASLVSSNINSQDDELTLTFKNT